MPLKVCTPSATPPRTSPYRGLTTVFIGTHPSKRVARRGATSVYMGCVWERNGKNQEGSFVLLSWQSVTRGIHLRIAICLSTTPGFSPMPLIVIMSVGGASGAVGPDAGPHGGAPGRQRNAR